MAETEVSRSDFSKQTKNPPASLQPVTTIQPRDHPPPTTTAPADQFFLSYISANPDVLTPIRLLLDQAAWGHSRPKGSSLCKRLNCTRHFFF